MTRNFEQDAHMRSLIVRLNLLSNVSAVNLDSSGGKATDESPGGRQPSGGGRSGAEWWSIYLASDRPERVIQEAEDELEHAHRSGGDRDIIETAEQLTARIRKKRREGWSIDEVARECRCTPTRVRQADRDTTVAKVLELHGKCTVRQIETITGVPKSTVQRIIEAEAA
jgi:hypothetical protein